MTNRNDFTPRVCMSVAASAAAFSAAVLPGAALTAAALSAAALLAPRRIKDLEQTVSMCVASLCPWEWRGGVAIPT